MNFLDPKFPELGWYCSHVGPMTPCQATRGLNLSEDIFAGLDLSLRGGWTVYREYFHVGKAQGLERLWHPSGLRDFRFQIWISWRFTIADLSISLIQWSSHPNDLNGWLQQKQIIRAETWALWVCCPSTPKSPWEMPNRLGVSLLRRCKTIDLRKPPVKLPVHETYCVVIEFLLWNSCGFHIHLDYPVWWKPLVCLIESLSLCLHWHGPGTVKSYVKLYELIHADFVICVHRLWNVDTSMMYFYTVLPQNISFACPGHYSAMDAIGFTPRAFSTAGHFLFAHWILHEPVPCESCHQGWGNSCWHVGFKIFMWIWWPGFRISWVP